MQICRICKWAYTPSSGRNPILWTLPPDPGYQFRANIGMNLFITELKEEILFLFAQAVISRLGYFVEDRIQLLLLAA